MMSSKDIHSLWTQIAQLRRSNFMFFDTVSSCEKSNGNNLGSTEARRGLYSGSFKQAKNTVPDFVQRSLDVTNHCEWQVQCNKGQTSIYRWLKKSGLGIHRFAAWSYFVTSMALC